MVAITSPASIRLAPARTWGTPAVYRRRRAAVLGLLLVVLALGSLALQLLAGPDGGVADAEVRPVARVSVVVAPGDTVWSIASAVAPDADPRPIVDAIVAANGGPALVAGQRLELTLP